MENLVEISIYVGVYIVIIAAVSAMYMAMTYYKKKMLSELEPKELARIEYLVTLAVEAAEQIFGVEGSNDEKLDYVMGLITKQFPKLDIELVRAIIESVVFEYKKFEKEVMDKS